MASSPQVCTDTELYIDDNCECDDCLSKKLDELNEVLKENVEKFDNEIISKIDDLQDNFANYYTQAQTDQLINEIPNFNIEVVEAMPDEPSENTMYLLADPNGSGNCNYSKWLYIDGKWEALVCDGDMTMLSLKFVTDCGENGITYINEGTLPEYNDLCELSLFQNFEGWKCEETEDLYTGKIPEEWFSEPPCTTLTASTYKQRIVTYVSLASGNDEAMSQSSADVITKTPATFPTYKSVFGEEKANVWWDYEDTLYAQGDDIPDEFFETEDEITVYAVERNEVTYTFTATGDVPSAVVLAVTQDGEEITETLDAENEYTYTLTTYDDVSVDGNIEDIEGHTIEKEISDDGMEYTFTFTEDNE